MLVHDVDAPDIPAYGERSKTKEQKSMVLNDRMREIILAMAECNMSLSEVSKVKHYHRNTVDYHCRQIRKKTGLNPRCFYDLVRLVCMVKGIGGNG